MMTMMTKFFSLKITFKIDVFVCESFNIESNSLNEIQE
jgi:hypothetical protein